MSNRRAELALVGLLLVGCVGAIIFVFVTMTGSDGKFTPAERPPAAARDEPDHVSPKAAAGAPESKAETPAEKPDPGPAEPVPEPKPEENNLAHAKTATAVPTIAPIVPISIGNAGIPR